MANLCNFDVDQHEEVGSFENIPKGEYPAIATNSEMKLTKNRDGEYLQFTIEIIDGPYKGRIIWDRLNLKNKNDTAVKIANRTLASICRAVGVPRPKDSIELHGKPLMIKVDTEERNDRPGEVKNIIVGYSKINGQVLSAPAQSKMPWKK